MGHWAHTRSRPPLPGGLSQLASKSSCVVSNDHTFGARLMGRGSASVLLGGMGQSRTLVVYVLRVQLLVHRGPESVGPRMEDVVLITD